MRNKTLILFLLYRGGVQVLVAAKLRFRGSSAMPLPFGCFFLCLLLFLLNLYFSWGGVEPPFYPEPPDFPSSPNTKPDQCHGRCGDIEIIVPFFLNNTDHACQGKYSIRCNPVSEEPLIKFADREFVVKYISYEENIVVLQDQALGGYLGIQKCGFLYNFANPIQNFKIPPRSPNIVDLNLDCAKQTDAFSRAFFPTINSSHGYHDYNLYYWNESEDQRISARCSVAHTTMFQWVMSFGIDDDPLSLRSAGFSHRYELHEDCFNCRVSDRKELQWCNKFPMFMSGCLYI